MSDTQATASPCPSLIAGLIFLCLFAALKPLAGRLRAAHFPKRS